MTIPTLTPLILLASLLTACSGPDGIGDRIHASAWTEDFGGSPATLAIVGNSADVDVLVSLRSSLSSSEWERCKQLPRGSGDSLHSTGDTVLVPAKSSAILSRMWDTLDPECARFHLKFWTDAKATENTITGTVQAQEWVPTPTPIDGATSLIGILDHVAYDRRHERYSVYSVVTAGARPLQAIEISNVALVSTSEGGCGSMDVSTRSGGGVSSPVGVIRKTFYFDALSATSMSMACALTYDVQLKLSDGSSVIQKHGVRLDRDVRFSLEVFP